MLNVRFSKSNLLSAKTAAQRTKIGDVDTTSNLDFVIKSHAMSTMWFEKCSSLVRISVHTSSKQTRFEMQKFLFTKLPSLAEIVCKYAISFPHKFLFLSHSLRFHFVVRVLHNGLCFRTVRCAMFANFTVAAHRQTFIQDEMFGFPCARINFMFNSYFVVFFRCIHRPETRQNPDSTFNAYKLKFVEQRS